MDNSSWKFRLLFHAELIQAATHGRICPNVWQLLYDLFEEWTMETTSVEGTNNNLKAIIRMAPYVGWKLLSDRLCCAKFLKGVRTDADVEDMVARCQECHEEAQKTNVPLIDKQRYFCFVNEAPLPGPAPASQNARDVTANHLIATRMLASMRKSEVLGVAAAHASPLLKGIKLSRFENYQLSEETYWIPAHRFRATTWCI